MSEQISEKDNASKGDGITEAYGKLYNEEFHNVHSLP
jgi:hypothetical protein